MDVIIVNKFTCNETTRERFLTVAAPPKSPRRVRREARSLAVQEKVEVARKATRQAVREGANKWPSEMRDETPWPCALFRMFVTANSLHEMR